MEGIQTTYYNRECYKYYCFCMELTSLFTVHGRNGVVMCRFRSWMEYLVPGSGHTESKSPLKKIHNGIIFLICYIYCGLWIVCCHIKITPKLPKNPDGQLLLN